MRWSPTEMMIVAAARRLEGVRTCFVGIGPPNIACALAKRTVAPDLELIYESGVVGADPARLPLSIGDPTLVSGARAVASMFDLFAFYLQGGLIDVAFLGASQLDRRGGINTTVVGDYRHPQVRLPGSGGACEIAINAGKVFVIMTQSPRSFVVALDFVTSPGHLSQPRPPSWGSGPDTVVTQLGVYRFVEGEMVLGELHPGATVEEASAQSGFPLRAAETLDAGPPPTDEELALLRRLDPDGIYRG